MRRIILLLAAAATAAVAAAAADPKFELADVRPRTPNYIHAMRQAFNSGRYELRNATMLDLIRTAFALDADKILGGPDWLADDRFDLVAATPATTTPETRRLMLQAFLKERFNLATHQATKNFPAYRLTAGKKPLLKPAVPTDDAPACKLTTPLPAGRPKSGDPITYACRNITLASFAADLPNLRSAAAYLFEYPIVDATNIKEPVDFDLKYSFRVPSVGPPPGTENLTLPDALEHQLGLKLERTTVPMPVLVVDTVSRIPTPNSPGTNNAFPNAPAQFEVAEIKPENPDDGIKGSNVSIVRGGRVRIDMTLKELIIEAWGEWNPDQIVGGPKSLDTTRFEVTAKMPPADFTPGSGIFNGQDIDTMRAMLRTLLIERFKLVAHTEDRPTSGYALVAAHPKLTKADPANRPGCKEGPGDDGKDPRSANPILARLITCRNMTLTHFAAELRNIGYYYFPPPIVNATGIPGRYDLTISFSTRSAAHPVLPPNPDPNAVASDPTGALSLEDALQKQLGLKLESRKLTAPVLVIDHVDETPTGN